ncbi:MAG: SprT family zinc-dependent metalloprotease [Bacteroidota bacterium]
MKHLTLGPFSIPCEIVPSSKRQLKLSFQRAQPVLRIEAYKGRLGNKEKEFLKRQSGWIQQQYQLHLELNQQQKAFFQQLAQGCVLLFGENRPYSIIRGPRFSQHLDENAHFIIQTPTPNKYPAEAWLYKALKSAGKAFLIERTYHWAKVTHSKVNAIRIKGQRSRWGSCSQKGNLNLNWHLIFVPPHLIDYLIIHELMHLREMNHSPAFWAEVNAYCPTFRQDRQELRSYEWVIGMMEDWES